MQIFLVILGAILGLIYGYNTDGLIFSSNICLFAGLTLIMPTLFKVKFTDFKLIFEHKLLIIKSLTVNFIILPLIAVGIGLLTGSFAVASGLFLLSVLSGGGMVMNWIKKSNADASFGFILLFINLMLISLSLLLLHGFGLYTSDFFGESYADEINVSNFAFGVLNLLIVIPFIVSRVIIFIKPLVAFIESKRVYISNIGIFVILTYLFALQSSQLIFEIYDFEPELIYISLIAVIAFYICVYIVARLFFNLNDPYEKAAFWHSVTRYITLGLVISTFTTGTFGIAMILPIMFAYIVQIPFAILLSNQVITKDL